MERPRYELIDTLRGLAIFCVIVYHFIYDLVHFYSMDFPWFEGWGAYMIQQGGVFLFVFISGAMSLCAKNPLRNGLFLVACGLMITLATHIYSPGSIIVFGILSLLGWAAVLTVLFSPLLKKMPEKPGIVLSLLLFLLTHDLADGSLSFLGIHLYDLPSSWYESRVLFPLGLPHASFVSADYFPLLPWIFPYWIGYYFWQLLGEDFKKKHLLKGLPIFSVMGRHSLLIYLAHQPILLIVCFLLFGNNR